MKKIKLFALLLLAGATVFTSCKKDEETGPAPSLSFSNFTSGAYEIDFATVATPPFSLSFAVTVTAEEEIATFTAKKTVGGTTTNLTAPADFEGKTSYTYNYIGSFNETDTYPVELVFTCTDKADQVTTKTFTVTKKTGAATGDPINTLTATLGAQSATPGSFFATSLTSNNIFTQSSSTANQAVIDLIYYYGTDNLATLCAPNDATVNGGAGNFTWCSAWTTKNATKFGTSSVTGTEFDAMTDDLTIAQIGTLSNSIVTLISNGQVIAFVTAAGKKGLIKVTSLTTGATGTISISVKVQQ